MATNVNKTTLKTYFNTGDTPTESNFADLVDSNLNLNNDNALTNVGGSMISFASGSTDTFHTISPPMVRGLIPNLRVWDCLASNPQTLVPVADNAGTGEWLFDDANSGAVNKVNNDSDFPEGAIQITTGGSDGNQTELSTDAAPFRCAANKKWWAEAEFKIEDHDACEFFFGVVEEAVTTNDYHLTAAGNGADRVGFVKDVHNDDSIHFAVNKGSSGTIATDLDSALACDTDNDIMHLCIHWDGSNVTFYGSVRNSGTVRGPAVLLHTHTTSANMPDDSNLRLCLLNQTGEGATHTMTVNMLRGAIWV